MNELFSLATDAVNYTGRNIFLTGKAGTGKTTFLKHIREHSPKNAVVVAPTGVAAINAGGVTMHSFFQLPFLPYLPDEKNNLGEAHSVDRYTLIKNIRFNKSKIDLLRELELLIIDEVSMLRADLLDAMDDILRHFRQSPGLPFGGVQVLFIGDLFQLPPVVADSEWNIMRETYESPFFFSAKVLRENPPLHIELKKIYRQSDEQFINLLNNIRNNEMMQEDFELLGSRSLPDVSDMKRDCITLCTHNYMADTINQQELKKLKTKTHQFQGALSGNFSEKALPTDLQLELKEGAQVMFVKNDSNPAKRYFNGKLAQIKKIDEEGIVVGFLDSKEELRLEKEKWKSIRYSLNNETGKVEEQELGSFTQYPVRLAWAITIHKSQGLTFDRAVIDAGKAFAPGQVYVALSRCRSLDGIYLLSSITPSSVRNDERIVEFSNRDHAAHEIKNVVQLEKPKFAARILFKTFDLRNMVTALQQFQEETESKKFAGKVLAFTTANNMLLRAEEHHEVAQRFIQELKRRLQGSKADEVWLVEKITGAKKYFVDKLKEDLLLPLHELQKQLKGKTKVRKYSKQVNELELFLRNKVKEIQRARYGELNLEIDDTLAEISAAPAIEKVKKGSSKLETLDFYKSGMKIPAIAKQRDMAVSTIEGHLAEFVATGEVDVFDFISKTEFQKIKKAVDKIGNSKLAPLKEELGSGISYGMLKMALAHLIK